jgi:cytochrome P450
MVVNFAALHTSSTTFTHILYTLAANPQWIQPLREEVERVFAEEGMTKAAMQKMVKLDSFFRESNRTNPLSGGKASHTLAMVFSLTMNPGTLMRKVLKPKTFRDGTHLPVGTMTITPTMPHQMDAANYANPTQLDPTRFEQAKDSESPRKYFTSVDSEYLAFGIGSSIIDLYRGLTLTTWYRQARVPRSILRWQRAQGHDGPRPTQLRRPHRGRGCSSYQHARRNIHSP